MEIYLDNSSTTKVCPIALDSIKFIMQDCYGNPSSIHTKGFLAGNIISDCLNNIAYHMGCNPNEVIFTSGATECNNFAIFGTANATRKKTIISSSIEHPSVSYPLKILKEKGYNIITITPNENGEFLYKDFIDKITDDTFLISIMHVNNETGSILPIEEVAKYAKLKNKDIIIHCDAAQSFCKISTPKLTNIDILSFSGHKIYAPKGIGCMYIKKGTKIKPLFYGGNQQNTLRPGTENVAFIKSLSDTISFLQKNLSKNYNLAYNLKEYTIKKLMLLNGINFNTFSETIPYILNFSIEGIKSEVLIHFLEYYNIYISSGSACSKGASSTILKEFNIPKNQIDSSIRLSFGIYNSYEDIDFFIDKLDLAIKTLIKI